VTGGCDAELVPRPASGRVYTTTRRVRLADADPSGRLRLDALARLLQDVGNDDFADAGLDPASPWLARRSVVVARAWPQLGERVAVDTWCGGLGGRWAERRSSLSTEAGPAVDVATLWVHVDERGRPARLPGWFHETYGSAAGERTVSARLTHPAPEGGDRRSWPVRATDLDVLGHVNNAVTWAVVEDECARRGVVPAYAELEYASPLEWDDDVVVVSAQADDCLRVWVTAGGAVRASALVRPPG
jgi:acyl-ACP thioesterase